MEQDYTFQTTVQSFLQTTEFKVIPLAGDASARRYYRIVKGQETFVLMQWEPFDAEKYPFLSVLNHFAKHQVSVPKVIDMNPREGLMLLEDLGDLTLERKFWEAQDPVQSQKYYEQALDELIKIHYFTTADRVPCTAFDLQFDTDKLLWEMNYGLDNLILGILQFPVSQYLVADVRSLFRNICDRIHQEPKKIVHRDYHSRNVMIKWDQVRVIDFQDARLGAVQYDLVSLLNDSYVEIPKQMSDNLLKYYLDKAQPHLPADFSREHFNLVYQLQTLQRCFKACGSFSSFYNQRKDTRYLKYITPTLKTVFRALTDFPEYKNFSRLLIDSGALDTNYENL